MRTLLFLASAAALAFVPLMPPAQAAIASNLPRYSAVTDASATGFTVSFRNLGKTEYVDCSLPAPVSCGSPADKGGDNGGKVGGIRNEAGTLQVTAIPDSKGGVTLAAYTLAKRSWEKARSWTLVGGVTRTLVADDGQHFAVIAADGSIVSYDIGKDAPTSKVALGTTGSALTLSATGRYLAWYRPATLGGDGKRCYTFFDTVTGRSTQTCDAVSYWDLVSEDNRVFAFAPDDRTAVFRSDRDGYMGPYKVDLSKGLPATIAGERLIHKPYQVADMVFIDKAKLAVVANRTSPTAWSLWSLDIPAGTIVEIARNASYGVPLRRFGGYVSFAQTNPGGVNAALYNVASGSVTSVDALARTTIPAGDAIPAPTAKVSYTAGGGYALWQPSQASRNAPIVIWLHGGPYRQIATAGYHPFSSYGSFDWMLEQMRRSGAVVAKLDYPGSYGYGRKYAESLTGNVGVTDVAAVKSLIATLRAKYGAAAPVYLVGNSYGGYVADKAVVELGSSVKGIYSISGVSGWEELVAGNPQTIFAAQFRNAPFGQQDPLFQRAEVLLKAKNIATQKVVLAHGDRDTSVSVSQTATWAEVLKLAGKNVQATIYPGEDHVFAKPENFADLCRKGMALIGTPGNGLCTL